MGLSVLLLSLVSLGIVFAVALFSTSGKFESWYCHDLAILYPLTASWDEAIFPLLLNYLIKILKSTVHTSLFTVVLLLFSSAIASPIELNQLQLIKTLLALTILGHTSYTVHVSVFMLTCAHCVLMY